MLPDERAPDELKDILPAKEHTLAGDRIPGHIGVGGLSALGHNLLRESRPGPARSLSLRFLGRSIVA